jgi:hypothetical protein
LQAEFFLVLKQVFVLESKDSNPSPEFVCEALLRDTFLRVAADTEPALLQTLLQNICNFIEEVYYQEYNAELIVCKSSLDIHRSAYLYTCFTVMGQQLTHIARRMSDGTFEGADPAPIIVISALLLHNKKHLKVIFSVTQTRNSE